MNLNKWLLQISWIRFLNLAFLVYVLVVALFAFLFDSLKAISLSDGASAGPLDPFFYSLSVLTGVNSALEVDNTGQIISGVEAIISVLLFGALIGIILVRMERPRTKVHLAPRVGAYKRDDGEFLLEFRLIVYPSPPIFLPNIKVSLHWINSKGERENTPLDLTRVQAMRVAYYLVFRAIVPNELLKVPDGGARKNIGIMPLSTVEVCITAIDSASDQQIFIHKEYKLPTDARDGAFATAVQLGQNGDIIGVDESMLEEIRSVR